MFRSGKKNDADMRMFRYPGRDTAQFLALRRCWNATAMGHENCAISMSECEESLA